MSGFSHLKSHCIIVAYRKHDSTSCCEQISFTMRVENNTSEISFYARFYGACCAVIGATYGAYTYTDRNQWNGTKDIESRLKDAIVGGLAGGFIYPVTAIVKIRIALSYLLDFIRWSSCMKSKRGTEWEDKRFLARNLSNYLQMLQKCGLSSGHS